MCSALLNAHCKILNPIHCNSLHYNAVKDCAIHTSVHCALGSLQFALSRAQWCESHGSRLHTFFMHPHLSSFHIELGKDKMVYFGISPNTWPHISVCISIFGSIISRNGSAAQFRQNSILTKWFPNDIHLSHVFYH